MKTTVEIPDDLFRRAKSEAALRGRKLKDLIVDGLRRELAIDSAEKSGDTPRRSLHDRMKDVCGIGDDSPPDYATNPKYMEGFGE